MSALAPLAVAVPLLAAALRLAAGERVPRLILCLTGLAAAAFSTVACALLAHEAAVHGTAVHWFGGWTPRHGVALGIAFVVDPAGAAFAATAAFLTFAAFAFAWTYYDADDGGFGALMLIFSAALVGFFLTGDLFNLFVFFELMSVSAYALTGFRSEDQSAVMGALSFAVINSAGAFLTLSGIALVYARTGALNMAQIAHALTGAADPLVTVAFALVAGGFLVKAGIVPFHFWLTEAHAVAPTPLCVLFSGIMVEAGLYAVARCYADVFAGALGAHAGAVRDVLLAFGLLTAVVGAVMCFAQRHLKRLLAFSTIAHSGIMLCAIALLGPLALAGFFVYVLGHGLVKAALFMGSGIVLNRYQTLDVEALRGKLRELPWLPIAFAVAALGLAGIAPFGTFLGKAMIDRATEDLHLPWVGPVLLVAAALTGGSVLNALGRMTFGWGPPPDPNAITPKEEQPETAPATGLRLVTMAVPMLVLLALSLGVGFAVSAAPVAEGAARSFLDRPGLDAVVLGMQHGVPLHAGSPLDAAPGVVLGCVAAALALAFAATGLFAHRWRAVWPVLKRVYETAMRWPHAWHSGLVTDEVTWFVVGAAALSVTLGVAAR